MTELAKEYQKDHPNVKIIYNADSSGTLLTQIEEGYECDLFFSAAQKQMDVLEADGFLVDGTRSDVVNNQVVVITLKDSKTKVKGLANLPGCREHCAGRRKRSCRKIYKTGSCEYGNYPYFKRSGFYYGTGNFRKRLEELRSASRIT